MPTSSHKSIGRSSSASTRSRIRTTSALSAGSPTASARPCSSSRRDVSARSAELVAEPTLYLFDGYNLLHAGTFADPRELRDTLASFVAGKGARGVLVFDGVGEDETIGGLEVRFAP